MSVSILSFLARVAVPGLLCVCLAQPAASRVVEDLYSARISVPDRSQASLDTAAREGLEEVLVKITGSRDVVSLPVLERAVRDAQDLLQQFSYQSGADGDDLVLELSFSSETVRGLVIEAGAPLWTANRPQVLVWLVIDGPGGRRLVGAEDHPGLVGQLRQAFERRGLPLAMPILDLEDVVALSPGDAWRQDLAQIMQASARYPAEQVLVGRAAALSGGRWLGDWLLYDGRSRSDRPVIADSAEGFLGAGVDLVADVVAGRFALTSDLAGGTSGARLEVSGVATYTDYAAIVSWLESIELVEYANVEWLRGDRLTLNLVAQTDLQSLRPLIELNDRLLPDVRGGDSSNLVYIWQK
ncbi:MAG: DUF2066 domain-containing protein [Chromatocurvus sp.]